jgi:hypothetical protein
MCSAEPDGARPLHPDPSTGGFRRICTRLGLKGVRLHDLRHLHATQLLVAGVPILTVSGRLGHANAATTLNVYAAFAGRSLPAEIARRARAHPAPTEPLPTRSTPLSMMTVRSAPCGFRLAFSQATQFQRLETRQGVRHRRAGVASIAHESAVASAGGRCVTSRRMAA